MTTDIDQLASRVTQHFRLVCSTPIVAECTEHGKAYEAFEALVARLRDAEQGLSQMEGLREEAKFLHARLKKAEAALRTRRAGHCGCAWCCSTVLDFDKLGEAHKRTCSHARALSTSPNQEEE